MDPGLVVLAVFAILAIATPVYVAYDTRRRETTHWLAWTVVSVFGVLTMWIVWLLFYLRVRDEAVGRPV